MSAAVATPPTRMHHRFREIYGEQIGSYGLPAPEEHQRTIAVVDSILGTAISESPVPLRPDAYLFLLVNIHQMLILPLSHPDSPTPVSEALAGLSDDLREILNASVIRAPGRTELAASHILWGTADVLDRLNLKSWRLWERDE